jgi:pimeloyl-ACP methyl ester carboxylesterase
LTAIMPKPSAAPVVTGFVESGDLQIFFGTSGTGRPVVLVHGWGADIETNWAAPGWIETLEPHHTLIAIDVRGHGRSSKPHRPRRTATAR